MPFYFINTDAISQISVSDLDKYRSVVDYKGITKFFFKFELIPPLDQISGRKMTISGDVTSYPFLEDGVFGSGIKMRPQGYLIYPQSLPATFSQFSLGFWLQPVNIPPALNSLTGLFDSYHLSLLDKASFSVNNTNQTISASETDTTFVLYEECLADGNNRLKVLLHDGYSETILVSDPYQSGVFHYFWISYHGESGRFDIRIDGLLSAIEVEKGSTIPSVLQSNPTVPFHINKSAIGYSPLCKGNFGLLDELIFQTEYVSDPEIISRHINLGSEFVLDETLAYRDEAISAFVYDDPTTINVSAAFANGSSIYVGKEDGKVLKGDRKMWRSSRDFSNRKELSQVNKRLLAADSIVDVESGALKLFKASARI